MSKVTNNDEDIVLSSDQGEGPKEPWVMEDHEDTVETQQQQQPQQPAQQQPQAPAPQGQPPASAAQPQPFEVRTRTGVVFRGNSPDEVNQQLQAYYDRLSQELGSGGPGTVPSDGRGYEGQRQPRHTEAPAQPLPPFNKDDFYKTFAIDPAAAMEMWFSYAFGDPRDFAATVEESYNISMQMRDRVAIADFWTNNEDFPASPEASALVLRRLDRDNVPLTSWNLEVAYRQLVRENLLVPLTADQISAARAATYGVTMGQQQQAAGYQQAYEGTPGQGQPQPTSRTTAPQIPATPPSRGAGAPPPPPNGAGGQGQGAQLGDVVLSNEEFENLSTPDMKKYMRRRIQLGDTFQGFR